MTEKPHGWGNTGAARPDESRALDVAAWVAMNTGIIEQIMRGEMKIVAANARYVGEVEKTPAEKQALGT